MKKFFVPAFLAAFSLSAFASTPQLQNLSKSQVEDVGNEFAANFTHTTVSAPETNGLWGVEVGVMGGIGRSPKLADVVDATGNDGSKFKNIYHAGLLARVHVPFDLFAELTYLPKKEISDVTVKSHSFALGWNAGAFFNWPLDVAIGANFSSGDVAFTQTGNNSGANIDTKISVASKSQVYWLGVSKTFFFFTPYFKAGVAKTKADIDVNASSGTIFNFTSSQSESVSKSGGYTALGANIDIFFIKLGVEVAQVAGVGQTTGKLSFDF